MVASGTGPKMSLTNLGASAQSLLDQFVTALTGLGVDLTEQAVYVSSGEIAWDGPSLTLYMGLGDSGEPGMGSDKSFRAAIATHFSVTIFVQLSRMSPANGWNGPLLTPIPSDLNDLGVEAFNDAGCLLKAANTIFGDYSSTRPGQSFVIGPVQSIGPLGGMSAMRVKIDLSLS